MAGVSGNGLPGQRSIYLCAVKEYWIVDPSNKSVEIYTMQNNAYALHQFLDVEGEVNSTVLKDFKMNVSALFDVKPA